MNYNFEYCIFTNMKIQKTIMPEVEASNTIENVKAMRFFDVSDVEKVSQFWSLIMILFCVRLQIG